MKSMKSMHVSKLFILIRIGCNSLLIKCLQNTKTVVQLLINKPTKTQLYQSKVKLVDYQANELTTPEQKLELKTTSPLAKEHTVKAKLPQVPSINKAQTNPKTKFT